MTLFGDLHDLMKPPALYERTDAAFWDDEHISRGMLAAHLDPEFEGASRSFAFMDRSVDWICATAPPATHPRLLDLGCGPGLYAERFARGLCGDGRRSLAALARPCAALRERAGARHRLPVPELPRARPGRLLRHRRHDLLRLRRALVRRAPRRAASRSRAVAAGRRARARRVLAAQARGLRGAHDVGGASRRRVLERGPALRGAAMPPLLRMRVA